MNKSKNIDEYGVSTGQNDAKPIMYQYVYDTYANIFLFIMTQLTVTIIDLKMTDETFANELN